MEALIYLESLSTAMIISCGLDLQSYLEKCKKLNNKNKVLYVPQKKDCIPKLHTIPSCIMQHNTRKD